MPEVISVEILNFLNFGDDDEEEEDETRLVGLRQASGRRQKPSRSGQSSLARAETNFTKP